MKCPRNWTKGEMHFDGANEMFPRMNVNPSGFEFEAKPQGKFRSFGLGKYLRK